VRPRASWWGSWCSPRQRRRSRLAQHPCDEERQLERLDPVEARVADRLVAVGQVDLEQVLAAADALGDVVTGELDVDSAGPGAERAVHVEEALDLLDDVVEAPGLVARGGFEGVAVHRVAHPGHVDAGRGDLLHQVRQAVADLAGAEPYLAKIDERETVLRRVCESLNELYDFILFDCPPALGLLTVNALVASDSTIIPVQCEYLALEGLSSLMKSVTLIKQNLNPGLHVGGIVLTMTDYRANLTREVANEVKRFFKDLVFDTSIPRNIRLAESPSFGKPICLYDPHSTGALAYQLLTQEVISKECEAKS